MLTRATGFLTYATSILLVFSGLASFPFYALVIWAIMSTMIGLVVWQQVDEAPETARIRTLGRTASQVAVAASLALFLVGVLVAETVSVFGFVSGAGILGVLALAGYRCAPRARRPRRAGDPPATAGDRGDPRPAVQSPAALPDLDVEELCWAWRRSYSQLQVVRDSGTREQLVLVRRACLDELERRDPAGFRRWLASGARAGSDPSRFIRDGRGLVDPGADDAG
ncbi:hypothetical protein QRX60_41620 [Amycolatopsis mongoliensis]|uniref:Uncharacterized protein n=1 Tax=Amycolatopsis mongoliensis TaxID=715475 RepID=A0A9Y2JL50_9PSEU|nr:hypothetical protein [Amycolatopsis sp. 4-36]WIY00493.1 hypothetical protein QRX60_41620 [Amycolatopsis sp. 4-36]